ncbi:MAG: histidinol phosphatase [Eudoraea sp.]|nr:histidinol phosphatase [Eudoraea sp.]
MLQIFGKKLFLIDHLQNFVDIHNHILPGIDDGAKTNEESIALIKGFAEFGVSNFIATPHIIHNYYPNTPQTINQSLERLKNELLMKDLREVYVAASAEHMIDDNFESILQKEEVMHMRNDYLLIEMSYLQPPINFDAAVIKIASKRLYPILAHPERYNLLHFKPRKYTDYKNQGIHFQLNLLSLGDFYGSEVTKMTTKLIEEGLIDYVGSDVHNLHQLNSLKELTISKKVLDQVIPIIHNTIETFY